MTTNRPIYKPEFWDKVQELDMWTNKYDPVFACQALGVPRAGAPARILQTANDVVFLYATAGGGAGTAEYRVIPIDGRKHDPAKAQDVFFWGHSVGRWEGDYAGCRLDCLQRSDVARQGRLLPLRSDARAREVHAPGQHASRMRSRSRTRRCSPSRG